MIYQFIYRCRRCSEVVDFGQINGLVAAEQAMTTALDRVPTSKITVEVFHECDNYEGSGIADLIGCERK